MMMSMRKPYVGGNWKMNLHRAEAVALAQSLADGMGKSDRVEVVIFPAFPHLIPVAEAIQSAGAQGKIKLGAQDFYDQPNGAFTGEVSLSMLRDAGVQVVLVGHSERRHVIGEGDVLINRKVRAALNAGFDVILCIGEKIEQRELGQTDAINTAQTQYGLAGVTPEQVSRVTIAYEPVWAIGTGKTATPADAQAAHAAIRRAVAAMLGDAVASRLRIQYGGSMKGDNAASLLSQPDIDGGLIGGASLKPQEFLTIVSAAADRDKMGAVK
jgi:triosephosphate isomerase